MENIFNNPTFLWIVGIVTPLMCLLLALIFKKTEPKKDVKQWISWGLMAVILGAAIGISGVYKQWTSFADWMGGIVGFVLYYRLIIYEFMIKMLPESWRKDISPVKK